MTTREAIESTNLTQADPAWLDEMWAFAVETGDDELRSVVEWEWNRRGIVHEDIPMNTPVQAMTLRQLVGQLRGIDQCITNISPLLNSRPALDIIGEIRAAVQAELSRRINH